MQWLGDKHPRFLHSPWTDSELEKLQDLIKETFNGRVDWVQVASNLGVSTWN